MKPQELFSLPSVKRIFEKVINATTMRLTDNGMDKVWALCGSVEAGVHSD